MSFSMVSRRQFAGLLGAASAGLATQSISFAQDVQPSGHVAFLSDTHIAGDEAETNGGVCMADHLRRVVEDSLKVMPASSEFLINGDCAYLKGKPEDYATFAKLIAPILDAGHRLHVTMGNHDDRGPFYDAVSSIRGQDIAITDKHVGVMEADGVTLVLLDSLWQVNVVTGEIGEQQLAWLDGFLRGRRGRPVLVVGHHNLQFDVVDEGKRVSGLADTNALAETLARHQNVRAYFYGHTHRWSVDPLPGRDDCKLVNLPAVAYVFDKAQPSGWVHGHRDGDQFVLQVNCLDESHSVNKSTARLSLATTG